MVSRVAVITGGNAGVGYGLALQLLAEHARVSTPFSLCLACRNTTKARSAVVSLLRAHPGADITTVELDTSNVQSVKDAAADLSAKFQRIDWLFLNAGQMPPSSLNLRGFFPLTLTNIRNVFATGGDVLRQRDSFLDNGLSSVFATNVLGHYALIRELEEFITRQYSPCHIIWTSSRSAQIGLQIDPDNIQQIGGIRPYENSKCVMDLVSMELNERARDTNSNVYSHVACPGLVMTELTNKLLPKFVWFLLWPLLVLIRLFADTLVINPMYGAYSLFWLSRQDPVNLDSNAKYCTCCGPRGKPFVKIKKLEYHVDRSRVSDAVDQLYTRHFQH